MPKEARVGNSDSASSNTGWPMSVPKDKVKSTLAWKKILGIYGGKLWGMLWWEEMVGWCGVVGGCGRRVW